MTRALPIHSDRAAKLRALDAKPEAGVLGSAGVGLHQHEHNARVRSRGWAKLAYRMLKSASVAPYWGLLLHTLLTARAVVPRRKSTSEAAAEYVETWLGLNGKPSRCGNSFEGYVEQLLLAVPIGYSLMEEEAIRDDDGIWLHLHWRDQRSVSVFEYDPWREDLVAVRQGRGLGYTGREVKPMPISRLLYLRFRGTGLNFEGNGLLRPGMPLYQDCEKLYVLDIIGNQRFAFPTPVATVNRGLVEKYNISQAEQTEELEKIQAQLKKLAAHQNATLVIPDWIDLKTFPEGNVAFDSGPILRSIDHRENRIAMSFLAQFLGHGTQHSGGNRAMDAVHAKAAKDACTNILQWLAAELNRQVVRRAQLHQFGSALKPEEYASIEFQGLNTGELMAWMPHISNLFRDGVLLQGPGDEKNFRQALPGLTENPDADKYSTEDRRGLSRLSTAAGQSASRKSARPRPEPRRRSDRSTTDTEDNTDE